MVKISMDVFVKCLQPERYEQWKQGKDVTALDHQKPTALSCPELEVWRERRAKRLRRAKRKRREARRKKLEEAKLLAEGGGATAEDPAVEMKTEMKTEIEEQKSKAAECGEGEGRAPLEGEKKKKKKRKKKKKEGEAQGGGLLADVVGPPVAAGSLNVASPIQTLAPDQEEDFKPRPIIPMLYVVPRTKKVVFDKERMSCQEAFEQFAKRKVPRAVPHPEEGGMKEEELDDTETPPLEDRGIQSPPPHSKAKMKMEVKKSRRHPFSKPPMRSPISVVKQETSSDEEWLSSLAGEEDPSDHESVRTVLSHLWQNKSHNFLAERRFNAAGALIEPYCAICTLFYPYEQPEKDLSLSVDSLTIPVSKCGTRTKPLIPEMCFTSGGENTEPLPSSSSIGEDGTSLLISCSKCCLQVHASECLKSSPGLLS
ncbi:Lysine-specific demethylase 4B [Acipenser ruthenus]|uniref:Lysine-specific demethylase 4B n=1 Tax=Acipenser ruthenus TaxID=7906 RepID=A0A444V048_ACIRT|nr:Lysine-specific demethylase 4B [Acipenser ruthenus]